MTDTAAAWFGLCATLQVEQGLSKRVWKGLCRSQTPEAHHVLFGCTYMAEYPTPARAQAVLQGTVTGRRLVELAEVLVAQRLLTRHEANHFEEEVLRRLDARGAWKAFWPAPHDHHLQ